MSKGWLRRALDGVALRVGEGMDRAFVQLAFRSRRGGKRASRGSVGGRLAEATELYGAAASDGRLFRPPDPAALDERKVRGLEGGEVVDVTWPSVYEALHPSHAKTLARCPENATARARWFRHDDPASVILCLHGWGAGQFGLEERAFVAPWLYRIGYDVLLVTLPFHAGRAPAGRWTPMFPSTDPVRANEGFAQAVLDLRGLMLALRGRGASAVGVTGMSLGGFTSALLATVEPELDFAVPMIPFASLPALLWDHGRGTTARRRAEAAGIDAERFAAAFEATTPLRRTPVMDPARMLIVAGERDRVTPATHARWLHEHFEGSELAHFPGSHLLQVGRGEAFRAVVRFLRRIDGRT